MPADIRSASEKRDDVVVPLKRSRSKDGDGEALDAVVVGGGVLGLACAWRATRRGLRVRVLERDRPGAGASHVAAGMLAPVGEANWGEEALMRLGLASARAWPGFAAELAADSGLEVGYEAQRRPPRRARSRRGGGAAAPLRADGVARPRRGVAAPALLEGPGARPCSGLYRRRPRPGGGCRRPGPAAGGVDRRGGALRRPGPDRGRGHRPSHRGRGACWG